MFGATLQAELEANTLIKANSMFSFSFSGAVQMADMDAVFSGMTSQLLLRPGTSFILISAHVLIWALEDDMAFQWWFPIEIWTIIKGNTAIFVKKSKIVRSLEYEVTTWTYGPTLLPWWNHFHRSVTCY